MPGPGSRKNQKCQLDSAQNLIEDARRMRREAVSNLETAKSILEEELRKVTEELGQIEE
jgi:hypothetical protein